MEYTHKPVEELTFTDDFMFGTVMKNQFICKGVIERLLHIKVGKIEYPSLQKTIAPFYESKGIRLDVYVSDPERVFDIEIQTSIPPSLPKRTRYYQSLMDVDNLLRGQSYAELKESYVIFITETDVLGKGKPLYVIRRTIEGDGEPFGDGSHIIYVNASIVDDTPLGNLMHDFQCVQPDEMYYPVLAERAGAFKNTEKGEIYMSSKWEQFVQEISKEAMERGMARGAENAYLSSIRAMMEKLSVTAEKAMDVLAIPQSEWARYKAML